MYEPVAGLEFDRIVTHPPYVPVSKPTHVFRDGGDDGELILRRAIEGLPRAPCSRRKVLRADTDLGSGGRFHGGSYSPLAGTRARGISTLL